MYLGTISSLNNSNVPYAVLFHPFVTINRYIFRLKLNSQISHEPVLNKRSVVMETVLFCHWSVVVRAD
jgi:hypothetical protein